MKNRKIFLILLLIYPILGNGQFCSEIETVLNYIESTVVSDMYFTGEFSRDEIRQPSIWVMKERIPFTQVMLSRENQEYKNAVIREVAEFKQRVQRKDANYLLFHSNIYDNQILVVLVNNRNPRFNIPGRMTDYETWSRMNGGMSYLFKFNEQGCFLKVEKKYIFNG